MCDTCRTLREAIADAERDRAEVSNQLHTKGCGAMTLITTYNALNQVVAYLQSTLARHERQCREAYHA